MKCQCQKEPSILPVEIGYYGRPVSKLSREELLDAIVELTRMYLELDRKLKNNLCILPKEKN